MTSNDVDLKTLLLTSGNLIVQIQQWKHQTKCKIYLTIKTQQQHHLRTSNVFIVNFERISLIYQAKILTCFSRLLLILCLLLNLENAV